MQNKKAFFKQRLFASHEVPGIIAALFLYISIFFGIFAIYLPYISAWEKPSRHFKIANIENINYEKMLNPLFLDKNVSNNKIELTLPNFKGDPVLKIARPFMEPFLFNPADHEKIEDEKSSSLAMFLNRMHYGGPLGLLGLIVFGLISVVVIFLIINGLMMVGFYKFKDKLKNMQGFFAKWHRKLFIWLFAPFFFIVLVGAAFGTSFYSAQMVSSIVSGENANTMMGRIVFPTEDIIKQQGKSQMLTVNTLIKKAKAINPDINFEKITLYNWNDKSAQIKLEGYNPYRPFLNGFTNKPYVLLSGVDGKMIGHVQTLDRTWVILLVEFIAFLHLLFGVDIIFRTIVAIIMFLCGVGVVFSITLYLAKKAKSFKKQTPFYYWFEKFSIFVVVGVVLATATLFLTQWLLPFDLEYRLTWQQGIFFNVWLGTLAYSFYEIDSTKTIKNILKLSGVVFILGVLTHWYKMGLNVEILNIFGVDLALLALGGALLFSSFKFNKKVLNG